MNDWRLRGLKLYLRAICERHLKCRRDERSKVPEIVPKLEIHQKERDSLDLEEHEAADDDDDDDGDGDDDDDDEMNAWQHCRRTRDQLITNSKSVSSRRGQLSQTTPDNFFARDEPRRISEDKEEEERGEGEIRNAPESRLKSNYRSMSFRRWLGASSGSFKEFLLLGGPVPAALPSSASGEWE
uniref:Uncharacterized protein n=1 Tax=Vespula pensylvanica TaxID=30213 RepID=A0A834U9Q6_VESPE|nr:hypothetical protein H0235_009114 [Vespula pensylvanica]